MSSLPFVSFVVPVRNDARRLERCLRSIRANRYPPDRLEILVLDNGSIDDSAAVAKAGGATVLSMPTLRLGEMRNAGVSRARGEIVALVDADHEIVADWITGAVDALAVEGVDAVGAPYFPPTPGTWVQRLYGGLRSHPAGRQPVEWLGSGNLAIRRSAFLAVGGFDTSLETCEDVDLCRKLRAGQYRIYSDDRLGTVHYGDPASVKDVFWGELWRGRDNVRVSFRAPTTLKTIFTALLPMATLGSFMAILVGALLPGRTRLIVIGAGLACLAGILALRVFRLLRAARSIGDVPGVFAVAGAYELGRALALAARFGYTRRRRDPVAA